MADLTRLGLHVALAALFGISIPSLSAYGAEPQTTTTTRTPEGKAPAQAEHKAEKKASKRLWVDDDERRAWEAKQSREPPANDSNKSDVRGRAYSVCDTEPWLCGGRP